MKDEQRVVFLKGKKVVLRPMRKETDLESSVLWLNNEDVRCFLALYLPVNFRAEEEWFDKLAKDKENIVLAIETSDGKFIGIMGLHRINWKDRTATTGAVIGDKEYWGKGYGTEAKMLLLDYAFNTLNLRKIGSMVIAFNKRSLAYSLHCGYKVEGVLKKHIFKKRKYWDEIVLGVFKKDWLSARKRYNARNHRRK